MARTPTAPHFSDLIPVFAESLRELSEAWAKLTPAEQEEYARNLDRRIIGEEKSDAP